MYYNPSSTSQKDSYYIFPNSAYLSFYYPTLETSKLRLRKLSQNDAPDVFKYCSKPETAEFLTWGIHKNIYDTHQFINKIMSNYLYAHATSWGIEFKEENQIVGSIGIHNYDGLNKRIEIGYVLNPDFWGRGIMTEALQCLTNHLFKETNLFRLQIQCVVENIGSLKVIEKSGYKLEALFESYQEFKGKRWDVKQYRLLRNEWEEAISNK